jgi:hypothetical protein
MTEILLGPTLMDGPTTKVKDKKSGKTYYKKLILREGEFQMSMSFLSSLLVGSTKLSNDGKNGTTPTVQLVPIGVALWVLTLPDLEMTRPVLQNASEMRS